MSELERVEKRCARLIKALNRCEEKKGSRARCREAEAAALMCAAAVLAAAEGRQLELCTKSVMSTGGFQGRKDCSLEKEAVVRALGGRVSPF